MEGSEGSDEELLLDSLHADNPVSLVCSGENAAHF